MWNYEAKCVLRDLRKCLVHLKVNRKLLRSVDTLYKTFSQPFGGVLPFNGIHVESDDDHDMSRCDDCPGTFISSYVKLGKDWALRYMEINWKDPYHDAEISTLNDYDSSQNFYQCARIIPALLLQHGATLQELTVRAPGLQKMARHRSIDRLFGKDLFKLSLPSLKTFHLGHGTKTSFCRSRFVQEIIHNACPNIHSLDVWVVSHTVNRYPLEKLPIFKRFLMKTDDQGRGNEIFADTCPNLNEMTIYTRAAENYNRIPWESVSKVWKSSGFSLRELRIDLGIVAQLYSHQDLAPLNNLQHFAILYMAEKDLKCQNFLESMKLMNFSRLFPALTTLHFQMLRRENNGNNVAHFVEPVAAELGASGDASNIRCLAFHGPLSMREQAWNLSSVFPNVHTLYVSMTLAGFHSSL